MVADNFIEDLLDSIHIPSDSRNLWVGYSGGMDSHVLLHVLDSVTQAHSVNLTAIHINHGLSDRAREWAGHCQSVCNNMKIQMHLIEMDATAAKGESPEAWARTLRYAAFLELISSEDVLYTAHHKDDVAETVLLQLFRGAGPAGLSAMPVRTRFGKGWHHRPLLRFSRHQLAVYARHFDLCWIDDESNLDSKYDRNFLRHNILPLINNRWPGVIDTLSRAAGHQSQASELLNDMARRDMAMTVHGPSGCLDIKSLMQFSKPRMMNVIRYWLKHKGLALPAEKHLSRILIDIVNAREDASPCVSWQGTEVRRYRHLMFASKPLPEIPDKQQRIPWDLQQVCSLTMGELQAARTKGNGIKAAKCADKTVHIRYRSGGEMILHAGHHHTLNKLFQAYGIASWYRDYVPLIYINNRLVEIAGVCIDDVFKAVKGEDAWLVTWTESDKVNLGANLY